MEFELNSSSISQSDLLQYSRGAVPLHDVWFMEAFWFRFDGF